ncbi:hypothetical protein [Tenacibaculum sp. M341]|uniref:hypothetical protein n=1 Tax=Tenacibaculum sp. M341 TaxID=2530339 RepID=UPI0010465C33|nr:hypothetical protein [Tenacibaculum sp. M341]TCI94232.1 hypothetical protein EYW44_02490 [Tenacibaculum sp. M341]
MSTTKTHKKTVEVSSLAQKEIESWKEYNEVNEMVSRYYNVSPNDALDMSLELSNLIKIMNDSLKIQDLKVSALKARVNVFENEVLRLVDMKSIPAIKDHEVNSQVDKMLLVFSSFNEKINMIYNKKKFDEEIDLNNFFELKEEDNKDDKKNKKIKLDDKIRRMK